MVQLKFKKWVEKSDLVRTPALESEREREREGESESKINYFIKETI